MPDHPGKQADAAYSGDVQVFSHYLAEAGQPFLLLDEAGGEQVHLRFTGRLEGREVVWDCRFKALDYRAGRISNGTETESEAKPPCFIEIGQPGDQGVPLRVGLNLAVIDIPAIQKMIIMIRNYKRLRRGRYEFGDAGDQVK